MIPYVNHAPSVQQFLAGPEATALTQRERAEFEGLMLSRLLLAKNALERLPDLESLLEAGEIEAALLKAKAASEALEDTGVALRRERLALANAYDAFVVDWRLPKGDGKTLVERLRAAGREEPVLMLTALSDVEHRVAGLDAGADDYLPKPFAFEELVARLRALLRRPPLSDQERTVTVGPLSLDGERRKVTMGGPRGEAVLNLRPKEYAMLEVFMRSADAALSRTVLAERVWGDALFVTDNALDVTVSGLRQRLDDAVKASGADGAPHVETIRGVGYRLVPGAE